MFLHCIALNLTTINMQDIKDVRSGFDGVLFGAEHSVFKLLMEMEN
jgi:hypothetical protein